MMDLIRALETHERIKADFGKGELIHNGNKIRINLPCQPTRKATLERIETDPVKATEALDEPSNAMRVIEEYEYWHKQLSELCGHAPGSGFNFHLGGAYKPNRQLKIGITHELHPEELEEVLHWAREKKLKIRTGSTEGWFKDSF